MSVIVTTTSSQTSGYGTGATTATGATTGSTTVAASATGPTPGDSSVSISTAAKIAAAEAADNAKDFTTLSNDVRATLDAASAAAKAAGKPVGAPDLSEMSGRALAAIILNRTGSFTGAEQAAAKTELRTRTRDEFTTALSSGSTLTALTGYNQLLIGEYDAISPEEREARGWTSTIRDSAANFVSSTSASSTTNSSLFDLLNGDGNSSDTGTGTNSLW